MFGQVIPFSVDKLKALYQNLGNYRQLVEKKTDELIVLGFLLIEDRQAMIDKTVQLAEKAGL